MPARRRAGPGSPALRAELDGLAGDMARVDAERAAVARRRSTLDAEPAAVSDDAAPRPAHTRSLPRTGPVPAATAAHRARAEASRREAEAATELADTAAAVNLPADRAGGPGHRPPGPGRPRPRAARRRRTPCWAAPPAPDAR
ncbi:hypothetical protein [Streptomyces sp. NPDC002845]